MNSKLPENRIGLLRQTLKLPTRQLSRSPVPTLQLRQATKKSSNFWPGLTVVTPTSTALVLRRDFMLIHHQPPNGQAVPAPMEAKLEAPATRAYAGVLGGNGSKEPIVLELPFGMPRFVRAGTLKTMIDGEWNSVLFRKSGPRWVICSDSYEIDLEDRKEIFKVGEVQVYS